MNYYATFFDKNYLPRGLVLIESLQKLDSDFTIYLLCLDIDCLSFFKENVSKYPQVICIQLTDIEKQDKHLLEAKNNRSLIEYYFTLSPCLPLYLLKKYNMPHICTLDADIKFYNSPKEIFNHLENYSIIITPHKFSKINEHLKIWGQNNVSFQIFKNNDVGINCLEIWRNQCLEWCKDELDEENNRFADQKYLDHWDTDFPDEVKILNDETTGIAPWNLNNYQIEFKDKTWLSNQKKLIFFHFHHNKFLTKNWATNGFKAYQVVPNKNITQLYKNYWNSVFLVTKATNLKSENFIREKNNNFTLKNKLIAEDSVFFKLFGLVFYLNLKNTNSYIKKILFKLYA